MIRDQHTGDFKGIILFFKLNTGTWLFFIFMYHIYFYMDDVAHNKEEKYWKS